MKKLSCFLFLCLLLSCLQARAQRADQFSARFTAGKASYRMADLKGLYVMHQLPFRPRVTADFPDYYYYELQAFYSPLPAWKLGLSYGTSSTGARTAYSDYSGSYRFDQRIRCREYGLVSMYRLAAGKGFSFNPGLMLSAIFSDYALEERLQVYDFREDFDLSLNARGMGIRPFLNFSWQYRFVELTADAGYLFNPGQSLRKDGKTDQQFYNSRGEALKPDWSGYRLGAGLGINLNGLKRRRTT